MMLYRPALVIAASALTFAACTGNDPDNVINDMTTGTTDGTTTGNPGAGGGAVGAGGGSTVGAGGGAVGSGGATVGAGGGTVGSGGATVGAGGGTVGSGGGNNGGDGAGGGMMVENIEGPCDVLADAGHTCVAAYSTIRRLQNDYTGPLYQLRVGSSAYNIGGQRVTNWEQAKMPKEGTKVPYQLTPEMGTLIDVPQTADGFEDPSIIADNCPIGTTCTVAVLYDQSGNGNHMPVAKGGRADGGQYAAMDDVETVMNGQAALTVGGHNVHSLLMKERQGYRQTEKGQNVPLGSEDEGMYMLADGTNAGTACCWDFGNVNPDPTQYGEMNTLFFGQAFWGKGNGPAPWWGADFEAGVWMGGSVPSDPGWGGLNNSNPNGNPNNPSMQGVEYSLGFLKTKGNPAMYGIQVADVGSDSSLTKAYEGAYPQGRHPDHLGAIVLGVGGDNSNNSYGTFYEGAVYTGYPSDATEQAVMDNIKAIGYGN